MNKWLIKTLLGVSSIFLLSGCTSGKKIETLGYVPELNTLSGARNLNNEVTNIAIVPTIGQAALLTSSELSKHVQKLSQNIIVTSMVNVNNFRESSDFGRLYSESMMTNFKRLGWNVIDFRGKKLFVEAKKGEFYLDRTQLKDIPSDSVIYVGTYGEYQNGLLLNMRVLNYKTNSVLTASNVQLNDENAMRLAKKSNCQDLGCSETNKNTKKFNISVQQDDCSNVARCECTNPDSCLGEGK